MLIPALLSLFNMARGEGKLSHANWLILCWLLINAQTLYLADTLAGMWIVVVVTIMPPHAMFSAIDGKMPGRKDGGYQWMQNLAYKATRALPHKWAFYDLGIVYGLIKGCLAIPAILWLGHPVLWLLLLHGLFLFVMATLGGKSKTVRIVDGVIGLIIGVGV
ncbi:MAG: hypothetical protein EBR82_37550 [Caulobacteraceae bacterium]|nr:hypothetical protein [Caulobacteraceae bacterium]